MREKSKSLMSVRKILLACKTPISRTDLERHILRNSMDETHATFEGSIKFAMRNGCITKHPDLRNGKRGHRGGWQITDTGVTFLVGLDAIYAYNQKFSSNENKPIKPEGQ